jgi:sec-independent protein translocase protein TatB
VFGIGATELIVVMVVALLVFGPKRLPELARSLGRGMAEFRRASSDLRQTLQEVETPAESLESPEPDRLPSDATPDATPDAAPDAESHSASPDSPPSDDKPDPHSG